MQLRWGSRRNSVIELYEEAGRKIVRKKYRSTYTAVEEIEAYRRVSEISSNVSLIRTLTPWLVNEDCLEMEFVPGETFADMLTSSTAIPENLLFPIVELSVEAHRQRFHFDCDPSNLIWTGQQIVVIDPIVQPLKLQHLSAVIFLHGIFKAMLRGSVTPWRWGELRECSKVFASQYCEKAEVAKKIFLNERMQYLEQVIAWNRQEMPAEGILKRIARALILVPIYYWTLKRLGQQMNPKSS